MWHILVPTSLALLVAFFGVRWRLQKFIDSGYKN
jgi:hypothetical protein